MYCIELSILGENCPVPNYSCKGYESDVSWIVCEWKIKSGFRVFQWRVVLINDHEFPTWIHFRIFHKQDINLKINFKKIMCSVLPSPVCREPHCCMQSTKFRGEPHHIIQSANFCEESDRSMQSATFCRKLHCSMQCAKFCRIKEICHELYHLPRIISLYADVFQKLNVNIIQM